MWTDYFRLIKLRRGRVITPSHGDIDFSSDHIEIEICKELFDNGFPYLELTEIGKQELYPNTNKRYPINQKKAIKKNKQTCRGK